MPIESPDSEAKPLVDQVRALRRQNRLLKDKMQQMHAVLMASGMLETMDPEVAEPFVPDRMYPGEDGRTLVVSFGGLQQRLGMPTAEFVKTLARYKCACLYIKDFDQAWYLRGIPGRTRSVEETVDYLRGRIAACDPERVVFLGTSAGAFAAILFGVLLGIDQVLALSPQSKVGKGVVKRFGNSDTPTDRFWEGESSDLVRVLGRRTTAGKTRIDIHYGAQCVVDQQHAGRLQQFEGVTLHPVEGVSDHNVAGALKAMPSAGGGADDNALTDLFDQYLPNPR